MNNKCACIQWEPLICISPPLQFYFLSDVLSRRPSSCSKNQTHGSLTGTCRTLLMSLFPGVFLYMFKLGPSGCPSACLIRLMNLFSPLPLSFRCVLFSRLTPTAAIHRSASPCRLHKHEAAMHYWWDVGSVDWSACACARRRGRGVVCSVGFVGWPTGHVYVHAVSGHCGPT